MYGEGNSVSTVVPPVVTMGTVAVLPATGANTIIIIALGLAAGLAAWGATYLIKTIRSSR